MTATTLLKIPLACALTTLVSACGAEPSLNGAYTLASPLALDTCGVAPVFATGAFNVEGKSGTYTVTTGANSLRMLQTDESLAADETTSDPLSNCTRYVRVTMSFDGLDGGGTFTENDYYLCPSTGAEKICPTKYESALTPVAAN